MAKQTFTTGQVLTAAQMTSLQQTAMGGGSATAKTANYVLVAADAGTTVSMNAAGATTITVNTSLFAAGDTVTIQNLGAGTCTITAGTATVNTSSSLALAQYEGGQLYFVSASAAIFFKSDGAAPAAAGGMTLINTGGTTLTGSSVTISSIPTTYKNLQLVVRNFLPNVDDRDLQIRINGDSTSNRHYTTYTVGAGNPFTFDSTFWTSTSQDNVTSNGLYILDIYDYANTATWKIGRTLFAFNDPTTSTSMRLFQAMHAYNQTSAITSIQILTNSTSFTSGTAYLYGVQ